MASKTIEVYFPNGKPNGIRKITRKLSPITTYIIPRECLSEAKNISGIDRQGIYFLIKENDNGSISDIYVGQTRVGINRLDDHNRTKDFWNKVIMFLSDNKNFSLDMISGLEEYAIEKVNSIKKYNVINSVNPKYKIDDSDMPSIEEVYEEIKFIMYTQGFDFEDIPNTKTINDKSIYHTIRKTADAYGVYEDGKFIVLKDSKICAKESISMKEKISQLRKEMIEKNELVKDGDYYILKVDKVFDSPSSAGVFVYGSSSNGWIEWVDKFNNTLDKNVRRK